MKTCSVCKITMPLTSFSKGAAGVNGYRARCKQCASEDWAKFRLANPYTKEAGTIHYEKYRDWYKENYKNNKARILPIHAKYKADRKKTDIGFRLSEHLRSRLWHAIKSGQKAGSAVRDLGCSIQHLKLHLQLFWDKGMTWDNWGNKPGQWNIDHIIPLASPKYDLSNREDFLKLNNFLNLQPLWVEDNLRKNNKEY